ncbi:MAG: Dabb family protein [Akkermansiaceae bacterium]
MEHHVYFWLKDEHQSSEERQIFEEGLNALCQSPNIESFHWGSPAKTAKRPVTDHSFDYAISLKFASMEDHDAYQESDDIHDHFIASFKEWWSKVLVMDVA